MLDYLQQCHSVVEWAFKQWEISQVFFPLFFAILTSYFVSNTVVFRDQRRRLFDEFQYLRRHLYPNVGQPVTWEMWSQVLANWSNQIDLITREMQLSGFDVCADTIQTRILALTTRWRKAYDRASDRIEKMPREERTEARENHIFDTELRTEISTYFRETEGHVRDVLNVYKLRAPLAELINAPSLRYTGSVLIGWGSPAFAAFMHPWRKLARWIDKRYAPHHSSCPKQCPQWHPIL